VASLKKTIGQSR